MFSDLGFSGEHIRILHALRHFVKHVHSLGRALQIKIKREARSHGRRRVFKVVLGMVDAESSSTSTTRIEKKIRESGVVVVESMAVRER